MGALGGHVWSYWGVGRSKLVRKPSSNRFNLEKDSFLEKNNDLDTAVRICPPGEVPTGPNLEILSNMSRFGSRNGFLMYFHHDYAYLFPEEARKLS